MIINTNNIQQQSFMIDKTFQEISQLHFGRKILQVNSSSTSFDTSQPSFIALLCVISVLTIALVISIILLCYRYYSHREKKLKDQHKYHNRFKQILSKSNNQQSIVPISITPTSFSSYSVGTSENLVSNHDEHHQISTINTLSSHNLKQSMMNTYLNSFQQNKINSKQLNSYLFIDLHSTSSETLPDNISKQFTNNTTTSGYDTSIENQTKKPTRYYLKQKQHQSTLKIKQSYNPRFLLRERSLPNNLQKLPQLRQIITLQQRHLFGINDTDNSSTTIINEDIESSNISTTTNDYDDSHAYCVNQNQIMKTIKEQKPSIIQHSTVSSYSIHHEQEPYLFEIVSTSPGDDSDIQIPEKSSPTLTNRVAYINDSIIV